MSIVCTICQDLITEKPQRLSDGEDLVMLALKCGHLFHRNCVSEWFQKTGNEPENGQCPCCKKPVSLSEGLRIFPSGDEESGVIAERLGQAKAQEEENCELRDELNQLKVIMEDTGEQLQHQRLENEILKYEFSEKVAQFDTLQGEFEERQNFIESMENNWKGIVDKMTNERQEAVEKVQVMEQRLLEQKEELEGCYMKQITELEKLLAEKSNSNADESDLLRRQIENLEKNYFAKFQEYEEKLAKSTVSHIEKSCQTDGRDAAILQARLVSYKSCLLHMESEVRFLEGEYDKLHPQQPFSKEFDHVKDIYNDDEVLTTEETELTKGARGEVYEAEDNELASIDFDDASANSSTINLVSNDSFDEEEDEGKDEKLEEEFADARLWVGVQSST